ncbi:hypothetical protein KEM56_002948 [Ascosphaera pollenicola]|nr:hypothetical protein KEM56_002948 [Ascosphaera pollenicola]
MSLGGGSSGGGNPPDLASVLRALSDSYKSITPPTTTTTATPSNAVSGQQYQEALPVSSNAATTAPETSYGSASGQTNTPSQGNAPVDNSNVYQLKTPQPIDAPAKLGTPLVDPSTITTWPVALKHVMKTVGQNDELQGIIRKLIRLQHDSENKWWSERNELLEKQHSRAGKQKQLDDALRAIGGAVSKTVPTPEEDQKELNDYDQKIYRELVSLSRMLDRDLRSLRIPFFAIHHDLVRPSDASHPAPATDVTTKKFITPQKLGDLQKRMLELLEDLCKD